MTDSTKGVVILGTTSAIARAVADAYARKGYALVVGARDEDENNTIAADLRIRYQVDVTAIRWCAEDFDSHPAFFEACQEALGEDMEGVILCSGFMEEQKTAQDDWDASRTTMDVNLTGSVSILNRFANLFEDRKSGFIAAVTSVAGDRGRQSNYIYGAAKAGLSTYLEGLRNRLFHAGVHVATIKPGFIDTKMTWGLPGLFLVVSPQWAARSIVNAIENKKNVTYTPFFWRYIMLIIRHIPEWQFKKMTM